MYKPGQHGQGRVLETAFGGSHLALNFGQQLEDIAARFLNLEHRGRDHTVQQLRLEGSQARQEFQRLRLPPTHGAVQHGQIRFVDVVFKGLQQPCHARRAVVTETCLAHPQRVQNPQARGQLCRRARVLGGIQAGQKALCLSNRLTAQQLRW
ncbi:hypothetical protein D3C76_1176900 [compost metagenome]